MTKRIWLVVAMTVCLGAVFSAETLADECGADQAPKLSMRIFVDGSDTVYVQGSKLWIAHQAFQYPGKFNGLDVPTTINGVEWKPLWKGKYSEFFSGVAPVLPTEDRAVSCTFKERGRVSVIQQPTKENDYTLGFTIDDRLPLGAQWYDISLSW